MDVIADDAVPARRALTGCATLAVMLVIYGSWLPFELDPAALGRSWPALLESMTWAPADIEDMLTNIAIFIPIGLFVSMRLLVGGSGRFLRFALPAVASAFASVTSEFGQTFIVERTASYTDVALHGLGALMGIALAGPAFRLAHRMADQLSMGLAVNPRRALFTVVAVLVLLAKLAPFDFTISPSAFAHSVETARWSPFERVSAVAKSGSLEDLTETAGSFIAFALLGILGVGSLRDGGHSRTVSVVNTLGRLILLAGLIELSQIVIVSHTCDALDMVLYVYGACVGAGLGLVIPAGMAAVHNWSGGRIAGRMLLTAALFVQFAVVMGAIYPAGEPTSPPPAYSIEWVPFYAQFKAPFARSAAQIVSSVVWYATLCVVVAWAAVGHGRHHRFALAVLATVSLALLSEAAHALGPARSADITEPVLALAASIVAVCVWRWSERWRRVAPQTAIVESV